MCYVTMLGQRRYITLYINFNIGGYFIIIIFL